MLCVRCCVCCVCCVCTVTSVVHVVCVFQSRGKTTDDIPHQKTKTYHSIPRRRFVRTYGDADKNGMTPHPTSHNNRWTTHTTQHTPHHHDHTYITHTTHNDHARPHTHHNHTPAAHTDTTHTNHTPTAHQPCTHNTHRRTKQTTDSKQLLQGGRLPRECGRLHDVAADSLNSASR